MLEGFEEVSKGLWLMSGVSGDNYHGQKDRISNSMLKKMEENKYSFYLWMNGIEPKQDTSKFAAGQYLHFRMAQILDKHFAPELNILIRESLDGRTKAGIEQKKVYTQLVDSIANDLETYVLSYNDAKQIEKLVERAMTLPYFDSTKYELVGVEAVGHVTLKILDPKGTHEQSLEDDYYAGLALSKEDIQEHADGVLDFPLRGAADAIFRNKKTGNLVIVDWKLTGVFDDWKKQFYKMKYARAAVIYKYAFNAPEFDFVVFNADNSHEIKVFSLSEESRISGLSMLRTGVREFLKFTETYHPDVIETTFI